MKYFLATLILIISFTQKILAQKTGTITGSIKSQSSQQPLANIAVSIDNTTFATKTDTFGSYTLSNIPVGSYNLSVSQIGYKPTSANNVIVISGSPQMVNFELEKLSNKLSKVIISASKKQSAQAADIITPLSVQRLTATEIKSNPGGNFDISRVIQALPGVAGATGTASFRNDIIIRGGAPNENVFYLDGIEIPVINHFQTQGSSGGPAGMLNVGFIEDVKLSSSAFDARYDNALASVFAFKQRQGNTKKQTYNLRVSGTEVAGMAEGPLSKNTTYMASIRRSYLQFLFKALDIPIRPNYWDFQTKISTKINAKTSLNIIGIGAIDKFTTETPKNATPENEYILRSVPYINQWNYTNGIALKRLVNNGYYNIALSRNMFNNKIDQFSDKQINNEAYRALKLSSQEIENKLRFDYNITTTNNIKYSFGAMVQYVKFNNDLYAKVTNKVTDTAGNIIIPATFVNYNTAIDFAKMGVFGQISKSFINDKLGATFGLRADGNTFTTNGLNMLKTLSPRASISYALAPKWQVSTSVGSYYKLPIYTALGYKNANNIYENKNLDYTHVVHYVAGLEYLPQKDLRLTAEVFHKQYNQYLVSRKTGISLANQGTDFLAIGNEAMLSTGKGQATGFELFLQKKFTKKIFATASYTYVRSKFSGTNGKLVPSAWDNIHLFSGIFGKKFKRNWELGLKYRFTAGTPYTPYDTLASRANFVITGKGVFNNNLLNTLRLNPFNQADIRIDKKINFKKVTLDIFLDFQNFLMFANQSVPDFVFKRNDANTDFATTNNLPLALDGSNGIPVVNVKSSTQLTPTLGIILDF